MINENTSHTETDTSAHAHGEKNEENRWVARFEELLKVKNFEELKTELMKLAGEVQSEIQTFDINAHLSPSAKSRLKQLEQKYNNILQMIAKTQKQFDREFNKSLQVLKQKREDAQKQIKDIQSRIAKHRGTLVKASKSLKQKIKKRATGATAKKRTTRAKKAN